MSDEFDFDNPGNSGRLHIVDAAERGRATHSSSHALNITDESGAVGVHVLDYVKVLYKRRMTALAAFFTIVLAVTVYTFTATPIYEARTRLLIEADNPNVVSFTEVINEEQSKADYYQTQYNILQSRALARRTLDQLKLWETPPFGGSARPVDEAAAAAPDETSAQSQAIDTFLGNLVVSPIRNSRLVDVRYGLPDPALATTIVNVLARNYIDQNLEYKFLASKEASDWLGERLKEQRQHVEEAEVKLQRYREQNDAISLEDRENIVVQKLADLNAAVTQAKTDRFQKEAVDKQLESMQHDPAVLDTFPAILSNNFIQQQKAELAQLQSLHAQLAEKLGEKHPEIIKVKSGIQVIQTKLDAEIAKVVQSVRNEYLAALAKENSLVGALNAQKTEAQSMNRKAIDYSVLERDVQSTKQLYDSLLQRAKETGISSELKTSNIRVVDLAERPRNPISPRKRLNMLLGLLGGAFTACGLVFFFEYLDNRIKTPDEVRAHLGLAHLGLLPAVNQKQLKGAYPLLSGGVPPAFSEAFRAMRTNVLFSSADQDSRSLVITSTGPREGKSMVAANLALVLAQTGSRVLLIDADMRKPKLHDIFGLAQEPGLSNLLVGNAKKSESVRKTSVPGLFVVTAGRTPPNPAELVGSARFTDFLISLKEHFDWVILDTPPVMAVTDAALIAHHVSGVLFVIGADMTSRHAARRAVDSLEQAQAHFIGAALNRVDLDRNAYYYSQYYRREYAAYYQSSGAARSAR
jgi:capsular exopolysaccharide synthesis family protein